MALRIRVEKSPTENEVFQQPQNISNPQNNLRDNAINVALVNAGKQIIMQSAMKISNHIGKSYEMRKANELLGLTTDLSVGLSSPVGAIAIGTKYALEIADSFMAQNRANMDWNLAWQRSGNAVLGRQ